MIEQVIFLVAMVANENRMHVLDANVFIHGASRQLPDEFTNPVTVPEVTEELRSTSAGRRFDVEQVGVYEPGEESIETVREAASEAGEDLSDTDIRVVALALEKDAVLVSDDFGAQNIAAILGIQFRGFLKGEITEQIQWRYRCTECGQIVEDVKNGSCPSCGGSLKKVPDEKHEL